MALGDLPQPAKALVKAVVNLERCGKKRNGSLLWPPSCLQQGGGSTARFSHLPLQRFRLGGGSWDPWIVVQ